MVEMKKTRINGRWDIILPEHRAARPEWYDPNGWEKARLERLCAEIEKGDTVYYVGAEEGDMGALCQMWGAVVVLVEPNPAAWPNIKAIWEANNLGLPHAMFDGFASNQTSKDAYQHVFTSGWPPSATGEIIGNHGFKELFLEAANYPQIRLAELTGYAGIMYPDIVSIDVEGSEWQVLRGMESILNSPQKPKIFLSLHPEFLFHQWKEYANDLRGWIKSFGYAEELLDYQHEVHLFYGEAGDRGD